MALALENARLLMLQSPNKGPGASKRNKNCSGSGTPKSWMEPIVIEKPMQFTMVKAVPLLVEGEWVATKDENWGESATTVNPKLKLEIGTTNL